MTIVWDIFANFEQTCKHFSIPDLPYSLSSVGGEIIFILDGCHQQAQSVTQTFLFYCEKDNLLVLIFLHLKNRIILTPLRSNPIVAHTDSEPKGPASCLDGYSYNITMFNFLICQFVTDFWEEKHHNSSSFGVTPWKF